MIFPDGYLSLQEPLIIAFHIAFHIVCKEVCWGANLPINLCSPCLVKPVDVPRWKVLGHRPPIDDVSIQEEDVFWGGVWVILAPMYGLFALPCLFLMTHTPPPSRSQPWWTWQGLRLEKVANESFTALRHRPSVVRSHYELGPARPCPTSGSHCEMFAIRRRGWARQLQITRDWYLIDVNSTIDV